MTTNVRTFLREFAGCKARARKGETIRIKDKEGDFLFTCSSPRKSLLGCAKGRIIIVGDLTEPTLPTQAWKPSL